MKSCHNLIQTCACAASFLGVLCASAPAQAEPPAPDEGAVALRERAVALRERAMQAMEGDEPLEARAALVALQAIEPSVDTECNLGMVARRLKLWVEATENLTRCVRSYTMVPPNPNDAERVTELAAELAMARLEVAGVTINAPPGAPVRVDGQPMGAVSPDREIFLLPGQRTIKVGDESKTVSLKAGTTTRLSYAPTPRRKDGVDPIFLTGWIGTGAAAVAGGVLLTLSRVKHGVAQDELATALQTPHACGVGISDPARCGAYQAAQSASGDLQNAAVASFAGAVVLGIGATIYTTQRSSDAPRVVVGASSVNVVVPW